MKNIFVLLIAALLIGCPTMTIEEMEAQSTDCVYAYVEEHDVRLSDVPDDYYRECWEETDKRIALKEKRDKELAERKALREICGDNIAVCDGWGRCGCMSRSDLDRILNGW